MKKLLVAFLFSIMLLSLIVAAPAPKTIIGSSSELVISPNLASYYPQNTMREMEIHITNSTNIITSKATCSLHIYDEQFNGGHAYANKTSTFLPAPEEEDMEMIVPASVFDVKGQYSLKIACNTSSQAGLYESTFYVTASGNPPADDVTTAMIWLLGIATIILLFYTLFMTIAKIVTVDMTLYDLLLAWGSYILLIILNYLSSEYLIRTYLEDLTNNVMLHFGFTHIILPTIAFIITLFFKSTQKKKLLSPQEINGGLRYG
jgi:hypothetical protein